ncbi:2Fe-2S iron-sulfur cluster-binding protein [Scleromatobacter humisilvae]|uniref:2Fe-2S iron-sulfur cluster-binding protein n=1 Tax=Scleromatobacter humisilvae TaxID=2897159 RepID=A0A9X1YEQ7_9BURK|nr:2Fe-2S iron-sulfur cluster-binding protein [Scleromatobacter humisilvae]MCK9685164.1 2Fe-2S iron-sulfur cluster-binding protein [Scleromatobacter humisilvae]
MEPSARTGLSRRDLRLASGLLLFGYIALHLANHALGLVSLDVAERALAIAAAFWHGGFGSVLLYGAFAIHLALAFDAIYARRTLRMAPADLVRVFLGLGIPTLLIGHAVGTRLAWQIYGESTAYSRVIGSLLAADGQGRQLALLVPGWLHGCIGVHFALVRRPTYQRLRPVLFALALLLPVLGALGFLAMARELQTAAVMHALSAVTPTRASQPVLASVRQAVLGVYAGACALVFVSRWGRSWQERRAGSTVRIRYPERSAVVPRGWSVLEASRSHHVPHVAACGGRARCSTCRVRIVDGDAHCPAPGDMESATLRRIHAAPDVRLACQLRPTGDVAVIPVLAPAGTGRHPAASAPAVEKALAFACVRWNNFHALSQTMLAQDEVFLVARFRRSVESATHARKAAICNITGDSVTLAFGVAGRPDQACREALLAARAIEQALDTLADVCARQFGARPEFGICVHVGIAALSDVDGAVPHQRVAAGPAVRETQGLQQAVLRQEEKIVLSTDLLRHAGAEAWMPGGVEARRVEGSTHPAAMAVPSLQGIDRYLGA